MKLRVVETGYQSPKTVSDSNGGKMILRYAAARSHHSTPVKETVAVSFWEKEYGHRKAPYRAARFAPYDTELQPIGWSFNT
jgi:hypothetical protein